MSHSTANTTPRPRAGGRLRRVLGLPRRRPLAAVTPGSPRRLRLHGRAGMRKAAATAAAGAVLAACASTPAIPAPSETIGSRIDAPVPPSVLDQPLVDQDNRPTSLAGFRGKVLVISVMMTLCQETCPLDTATFVQTARAVQRAGLADKVQFVSITVDPDRDTPARLAAYRNLFAPPPPDWRLLTGSPTAIADIWKYLGVYHEKVAEASPPATDWMTGKPLTYDVNHADLIFFIDRNGHERFAINGIGHVQAGTHLPSTLDKFLNEGGRRNLANPDAGAWTARQALQVLSWLTNQKISS